MYELISLTEHDHYIDCPAKIGVVRISDSDVVLIDSGSDKDAAKKVLKVLTANNWKLTAIYNTHSHADHIGGNRFLQEKTGCKIYAPGLECAFTNHPELEPMGLYGGLPFSALKHKFLLAQESTALPLTNDCLPEGWQLLNLPGHSFDMAGFVTKDGTAFIADCVSSEETLNKYGIGYLWDAGKSLETLSAVKSIGAKRVVPSHATVTEDISSLADLNIRSIREVINRLLAFCKEPIAFDELLKKVFDSYALTMTAQQYVLIGSTVRSYLSYLCDAGKVTYEFTDNKMYWKAV